MSKCPKCGRNSEYPVKTWKIKQTPIALFECSSCKARWRSKVITEAAAFPPVVESAIPAIIASPPAPITVNKIEVGIPVETTGKNTAIEPIKSIEPTIKNSIEPVETTVKNIAIAPAETATPIETTSFLSSTRKFFSSIVSS